MFGTILKELRLERNMKQEDLAKLLGINKNTISKYETGKREPSIDMLIKIADIFDVSVDYLVGRTIARTSSLLFEELTYLKSKMLNEILIIIRRNLNSINFIYALLKFLEDKNKLG